MVVQKLSRKVIIAFFNVIIVLRLSSAKFSSLIDRQLTPENTFWILCSFFWSNAQWKNKVQLIDFSRLFRLFEIHFSKTFIYLHLIPEDSTSKYKINKKRIIKKALPVLEIFQFLVFFINNRFPWKRNRNEVELDKISFKRGLTVKT